MLVAPRGLKSVVFLASSIADERGAEALVIIGTGFFVAVPYPGLTGSFHYLVTARHVARDLGAGPWFIIGNRKDGAAEKWACEIDATGEPRTWEYHPDVATNNADVAITPIFPPEGLDVISVPESLLVRREEIVGTEADQAEAVAQTEAGDMQKRPVLETDPKLMRLRRYYVGDDVTMIGLFLPHFAPARMHPIVRVGNLAMVPWDGELVETEDGPMQAFLIEARSIGGLSGSPVWIEEKIAGVPPESRVLGVARGHWELPPRDRNTLGGVPIKFSDSALTQRPEEHMVNYGIASVVPAWVLLETLNQPALVEGRNAAAADLLTKAKERAD